MSQSHHKTLAKSPQELCVRGDYIEICIGRIILDATVRPDGFGEEKKLILFETVFSNLWDYRIPTYQNEPRLIDSNGFQHSAHSLDFGVTIAKSKLLDEGTEIQPIANEIEEKARGRGWIAFPKLGKTIVPHRLIFQIYVFDPGCACGSVRHSETLEIIFDLSLFGRLLENGKN